MVGMAVRLNEGAANSFLYLHRVSANQRPSVVSPVEPVESVRAVRPEQGTSTVWPHFAEPMLPALRAGADPVELAVRGRIQYLDPNQKPLTPAEEKAQEELAAERGEKVDSPAEVMKETECQTCKERKYQDGSDDPGVSFKMATKLSPERAATAVRGHEMEHVVHERARAEREERKVVSQSVSIHTAICPECGRVYVSGGTTRTTTASQQKSEAPQNLPGGEHELDTRA